MELKAIDFEEATRIYKTHFIGVAASFYDEEAPGIYTIGDMLWDEFEDAEFLLGYEGDKPLALAIYVAGVSDYDRSGIAVVKLYTILTSSTDEQRGTHFVNLLFQLRARFMQAKGEYFSMETAPNDGFTVEMLEATEFKLIAPFALMRSATGTGSSDFEVKPAGSVDITFDLSQTLPGTDPHLGERPIYIASATFDREIENGNTYEVTRAGERLGYFCIVPDPGGTIVLGKTCGRLLYAHPWDAFELYRAARQITVCDAITIYAPLTEPRLVRSLEDIGYRTVGAKLSFRLNLL